VYVSSFWLSVYTNVLPIANVEKKFNVNKNIAKSGKKQKCHFHIMIITINVFLYENYS